MEDLKLAALRWKDLELLQEHYKRFEDFLYDVMHDVLGFTSTDIQMDIGMYLAYGPKYRMVQAQRGEAKTTITAIYIVWRIIHNPRLRALIFSAGSELATQIANLVIQIIMTYPPLKCLRPDTSAGDRSSVKGFDVHHSLKGTDKSPTVACLGITSSSQGFRADVLVADDIESSKNSQTAGQRERLLHLTRDFTSLCSTGDIIYLGTPQLTDSIYNSLPSRGFDIRIWPGRYPTAEELPHYHKFLAPILMERLRNNPDLQQGGGMLGKRGQPTDPLMMDEATLIAKEIDQGAAYFQLQHMLDTRLMDEARYPLKTRDIVFMPIPFDRAPLEIDWAQVESKRIPTPTGFPIQEPYYEFMNIGQEFGHFQGTHMYVDPAGGGQSGDEVGYAVTKFCAGRVYVCDCGGLPGGYSEATLEKLTDIAEKWKPSIIEVEENFGKGAFMKIWQPILIKRHKCGIIETWEAGQKELRIIDVLEPLISMNRLVMDTSLIAKDWATVQMYPPEKRSSYSLLFQLARITRDKGALVHDDRLDALASSCRYWAKSLAIDKDKALAKARQDNYNALIKNPLGNGHKVFGKQKELNSLSKFRRKL